MDRIENFLLETRINYLLDNEQWDFLKEIIDGKYEVVAPEGVSGLNYIEKERLKDMREDNKFAKGDTVISKKDFTVYGCYIPQGAIGIVGKVIDDYIDIAFSFPSYFGMNVVKLKLKNNNFLHEYIKECNEQEFRVKEEDWLL